MKTTYEKLWERAQRFLEEDVTDLYVLEGKGMKDEAVACSLSGMMHSYYAVKYLLIGALRYIDEPFDEGDRLGLLIETVLITGVYPVVKDNLLWAYKMENWDDVYILQSDNEPYVEPVTYAELQKIVKQIRKLKDVFDGKEVSEDWYE